MIKDLTLERCYNGKPHKFELVAESRQADHYWCEVCGSYRRDPNDSDDQEFSKPQTMVKM